MAKTKISTYKLPNLQNQAIRLNEGLKILGLEGIRSFYQDITDQFLCKEDKSFLDYLEILIREELIWREEDRIKRWRAQAKFPWIKTLEDFNSPFLFLE